MSDSKHSEPKSGGTSTECAAVQSQLPLWAGSDLEAAEQSEVERHLERCATCALAADRAQAARAAYLEARVALPEGEPSLWPALRTALVAEGRGVRAAAAREQLGTAIEAGARDFPAERALATRGVLRTAAGRWAAGLSAAAALVVLVALYDASRAASGGAGAGLAQGDEVPASATEASAARALEGSAGSAPQLADAAASEPGSGLRRVYLGDPRIASGARSALDLQRQEQGAEPDPNAALASHPKLR